MIQIDLWQKCGNPYSSRPNLGCFALSEESPSIVLPRSSKLRHVLILIGVAGILLQTGCMQRRFLIRSNPEGALVTIDHQPVGHTPIATPFTYYGTREIELEKDGYETVKVKQTFNPKWYQIPPLDFISDNFWPRELRDDRVVDFQMQPKASVNESHLIDRANELRANSQRGTVPMPLVTDAESAQGTQVSGTQTLPIISERR